MRSETQRYHLVKRIKSRLLVDVLPTTGMLIMLAMAMVWWNR